jgi:hypothetical protein
MKYKIIYSVVVHESPECFFDMLANVYLANMNQSIFLVVNCNHYMYRELNKLIQLNIDDKDRFIINPNHYDKKLFTKDLLRAHMQNFDYIKEKGYEFDYYCLLASNCLFIKQFNIKEIEDLIYKPTIYTQQFENHLNGWDFEGKVFRNKAFIQFCRKNSLKILFNHHEGAIYRYEVFEQIIQYIRRNQLLKKIQTRVPVEELLFPMIENLICNAMNPRICKIYWKRKNYTPLIEDIEREENYMVKRVDRKIDDRLRLYIRYRWIKKMKQIENVSI